MRNAEHYAICAKASDLVEAISAVHKPRVAYFIFDEMPVDPDGEAATIATADQFHMPLSLKALEAGKHVLLEKPLGLGVEEYEEIKRRL